MSDAHKSDLYMVIVTLLAAISWMFSKEAVLMMPPILFIAVRFLLAGAVLALISHRVVRTLSRDQIWRSVRVGLVFGVAMSCWIMGLFHASHVGEGAFLTSLGVVIVPIIAVLIFREPQSPATWAAIPVAVAGLALLSLENGFQPEIGQAYFVIAATIFALYFTLNTRAANTRQETDRRGQTVEKTRIPALPLTALVLMTVGVLALIFSLFAEAWHPLKGGISGLLVTWVLLSALVGTAARFLLQTYAQSLSPNSHGAVILVLEPIWVALLALAWFGETMTLIQFTGCMLIFAALIINRWTLIGRLIRQRLRPRRAE
ncbi:MAG: DMT family transporter [Marinobacter sp.]|nr:DMT family transporter [Marinobacter sp.]